MQSRNLHSSDTKMRQIHCTLTSVKFSEMSLISDVGHLMPQQQNRCYVIKSNPVLLFYLIIYINKIIYKKIERCICETAKYESRGDYGVRLTLSLSFGLREGTKVSVSVSHNSIVITIDIKCRSNCH